MVRRGTGEHTHQDHVEVEGEDGRLWKGIYRMLSLRAEEIHKRNKEDKDLPYGSTIITPEQM